MVASNTQYQIQSNPASSPATQTVIEGMGELHLEIIVDRLRREFKVECEVGAPQVNYREGISKANEVRYVHKKQSGGSGQFADVAIRFEPGEPGTGFVFKSEIKGGSVPKEYVPGVVKGLEECMSSGNLAGESWISWNGCGCGWVGRV